MVESGFMNHICFCFVICFPSLPDFGKYRVAHGAPNRFGLVTGAHDSSKRGKRLQSGDLPERVLALLVGPQGETGEHPQRHAVEETSD